MVDELRPTRTARTAPLQLPASGPLPAAPAAPAAAAPATQAAAVVPAAAYDATALTTGTGQLVRGTGQLGANATKWATAKPTAAPAALPDAADLDPVEALDARFKELQAAREKAAGLDAELAAAMARLGPGLTADQQQAFVDAFQAKHAQAYADVAAAEAAMATTIAANKDALVDAFFDHHIDADNIYQAFAAMAPANPTLAVAFGAALLADPRAAERELGDTLVEVFIQPNLAGATAEAARNADPDSDDPRTGAQAAHAAMVEPLGSALAAYEEHAGGLGALGAMGGAVKQLQESIADFGKVVAKGEAFFEQELAAYAKKWQGASGAGKALAIAGLVIGVVQFGAKLADGDLKGALQSLLETSDDALQVMLGMEAVVTAIGPGWANMGARCVPLLGAVTSAMQACDYFQDGAYVAAGGAMLSATGGVLLALGVCSGGTGMVIIAAGQAIVAAYNLAESLEAHEQQKADYLELLTGIGVAPALAGRMAEQTGDHIAQVEKQLGLQPGELAAILQRPGMEVLLALRLPSTGPAHLDEGNPFTDFLRQAFPDGCGGFDGKSFVAFMEGQVAAGTDMAGFAGMLAGAGMELGQPQTPEAWAAAFDRFAGTMQDRFHDLPEAEMAALLEAAAALRERALQQAVA